MKKLLFILALLLSSKLVCGQYSTVYNGVTYTSNQPYNLDIFYFRATDLPEDAGYQERISSLLIWLQSYFRYWMNENGYGNKSFGLWRNESDTMLVRIIPIDGAHTLSFYSTATGGNDTLISEVYNFFAEHPEYVTSEHAVVSIGVPDPTTYSMPYYGWRGMCFYTDFPTLSLDYMGMSGTYLGDLFVTYFGGMAHEMAHGMNAPHSHQTTSENLDPDKGENLMAAGNYTLTASPTFINRATCAILATSQVFLTEETDDHYNGNISFIKHLRGYVEGDTLVLSGTFVSNRTVTDVNFYQDPYATPSDGYERVAFSVSSIEGDSFYMAMPAKEVLQSFAYPPTGPYNLQIELVLANGELAYFVYPMAYYDSVPVFDTLIDIFNCQELEGDWIKTEIGDAFYPVQVCYHPETNSISMYSFGSTLDMWEDGVGYLYTTNSIESSDTLTVRVKSVSETWNHSGGLMIRNNLSPTSAFSSISALDYRGVFAMWRDFNEGAATYQPVTALSKPMWLRIIREANVVDAYYSENGSLWHLYHTTMLPLNDSYHVGLFVSGTSSIAEFDYISLNGTSLLSVDASEWVAETPMLYPNPTTDKLYVFYALDRATALNYHITDITGRTVHKGSLSTQKATTNNYIDVSSLSPGTYILQIYDQMQCYNMKFVKQ